MAPMLALSEALVREGWEVHFFAPKPVKPKVEGTGATFCHYGTEDWDLFAATRRVAERLGVEPDQEVSEHVMPYAVVPSTLDVLPYLIGRMAQIRPAFMIYDAACPWAWVLSQLLRIPAVSSMTALPMPLDVRATSSSTEWSSVRVLDATTAAIKKAYGIELDHNNSYANYSPYTIMWTSRTWHKGNDEFPRDQFRYWGSPLITKRKPVSNVEAGDCVSSVLSGLGDRKLVFVSLGTVATGPSYNTYGASIEDFYRKMNAVATSMPEVVFVYALGKGPPVTYAEDGRAAQFDGRSMPENVTAVAGTNQLAVLARTSVFVTHCGMNSSSEAVAYEVPVVAVPIFGDQIYNAHIFEENGCGIVQRYTTGFHARMQWRPDHSRITEESLGTAVRRVLQEPRFREAVRALRAKELDECGQPLSEKLADLLKHVVSQPAGRMFP